MESPSLGAFKMRLHLPLGDVVGWFGGYGGGAGLTVGRDDLKPVDALKPADAFKPVDALPASMTPRLRDSPTP